MAGERESNPDEILSKLQRKERKRSFRPINLYKTAYEQEENRVFEEKFLADTPEANKVFVERMSNFFEEVDRRQEIKQKARADLTPEERDALDLEETLADLKATRSMSRRITDLQEVDNDKRSKLLRADPVLITPILIGVMKRPARLEKAQRNVQRILRKRQGEDDQRYE
jgi:hypothetical protein